MDINKVLNGFASKDDLIQYIKELPDDAKGVLIFQYNGKLDTEDGEEVEATVSSYKEYGEITPGEILLMAHDIIDFARGV